ncbi:leucine-rich repeat serine/threonine-protein kinase 1-like, partial [Oncorhynchus clarkii lewisi]
MSYWSVGLSKATGDTQSNNMEEQEKHDLEQDGSLAVEDMGAKASAMGSGGASSLGPSPTLENIQAAYGEGESSRARELIQQACCVECSAASPRLEGLRLLCVATQHGDAESVSYLLHEARVPLPLEPSEGNPAILAAHYGHVNLVRELLDSVPGPCVHRDLLNWMLVSACQQGHLEVVRMLVQGYHADAEDCAIHQEEFAVITGLPLYAAARAGNEEIARFLLQNGAGLSSYTLMDYPAFSRLLVEQRLVEEADTHTEPAGEKLLCGRWSGLKLPWLELDWLMDVSSRISHLDLSCNSLSSLPSVVPWGLIQLRTLDLSNNLFKELHTAQSSQEIICS